MSDKNRAQKRDGIMHAARSRFPITDFSFQNVALDGFRGECAHAAAPSFRNISRDYFTTEARNDFASEAAFFAMIIITAAIPVINSVHAMTDFVRAIGGI